MRNPLSPSVFLVRNKSKTIPLMGVIVLAILLVTGIVAIMDSIPLSIRTTYGYSKFYLGITPRGNNAMTPVLRETIQKESPVDLAPIITCRAADCEVKSIVGPWRFVVVALSQKDMPIYLDRLGGGVLEGRLPSPGKPEAIVSEPVARNLGKKLGDSLLSPQDTSNFSPNEVKIVGIVKMKYWMSLMSIEYHQKYHFPPIDLLIAMSKDPKKQDELDHWAFDRFKGQQARVFTYYKLEEETADMFKILYSILNVVIGLLVIVITLMMAMLMNIYQSQRIQEFGLLQALGYSRRTMIRRALLETALIMAGGWILGLASSIGLLSIVKAVLFEPRAFMLDPFDKQAYIYTIPIPVVIFLVAALTIQNRFRKFDPVGVVERRLV